MMPCATALDVGLVVHHVIKLLQLQCAPGARSVHGDEKVTILDNVIDNAGRTAILYTVWLV